MTHVVSNLQVFWQYSDMAYVVSKFKITNRSNSQNIEGACHVPPADQVVRRWSSQVIDLEIFFIFPKGSKITVRQHLGVLKLRAMANYGSD